MQLKIWTLWEKVLVLELLNRGFSTRDIFSASKQRQTKVTLRSTKHIKIYTYKSPNNQSSALFIQSQQSKQPQKNRRKVKNPKLTVIGEPVLSTSWPLTRPSVPSIAIVRTMFSPKCWATSSTNRTECPWTSSAVKIGGKPSSNLTSTTAPMTWHTCPIDPAPVNSSVILPLFFGAGGAWAGAAAAAAEVE